MSQIGTLKNAVKTELHPYSGFWKDENCNDSFGWAIGPAGEGLYYISFCGPGGCFAEGTYRPNTTIINDPKYNVADENTIDFWSQSGWSTHVRGPGRNITKVCNGSQGRSDFQKPNGV